VNSTTSSEEPTDYVKLPAPSGKGRVPAGLDPGIAHPARVYSYWLGGADYYPADREVALEVVRLRPEILAGARANRAFGRRVTAYAAMGASIRQFLDIGAGLPAPEATHEISQRVSPACRTVYADNDPLVIAHVQARLAARPAAPGAVCIDADLRDPEGLLQIVTEVLDFSQPVAVLLLAVLHFMSDADDPARIVGQFAAALAPGSLIAISHVTADFAPGAITDAAACYNAPSLREAAPQVADVCGGVARIPIAAPSRRWAGPSVPQAAATGEAHGPDADAEMAELARRAAEFPDHKITRETALGGTHYVAQSRGLDIHPYLVMTSNPSKLFAALAAAS
jgi:hypothetical protein